MPRIAIAALDAITPLGQQPVVAALKIAVVDKNAVGEVVSGSGLEVVNFYKKRNIIPLQRNPFLIAWLIDDSVTARFLAAAVMEANSSPVSAHITRFLLAVAAAIFSLCSVESTLPRWEAESFARCNCERLLPFRAAEIFALADSLCARPSEDARINSTDLGVWCLPSIGRTRPGEYGTPDRISDHFCRVSGVGT